MGIEFGKKIDNETMEINNNRKIRWKRSTLQQKIANLQLRLDKLRAILAEHDAA